MMNNFDDELDFSEIDLDSLEDIGYKSYEYFNTDDGDPLELDFDY